MQGVEDFVREIEKLTRSAGLDVSALEMDHICYRVETSKEYHEWKLELSKMGRILIEDEINGRLIATFELFRPIIVGKRCIRLIELPMPKSSVFYPSGWEHAEFVVGDGIDLMSFAESYPNLDWDLSGMQKDINPDIRLKLSSDPPRNIKLHHMSLDKVIEIEKRSK